MLIPSQLNLGATAIASLSRRVNANSQHLERADDVQVKLIKKGEC